MAISCRHKPHFKLFLLVREHMRGPREQAPCSASLLSLRAEGRGHDSQHPAGREVGNVRPQSDVQHIYKQQFASVSLTGESVVGTSHCIDYEFVIACSEKHPGGCSSVGLWL